MGAEIWIWIWIWIWIAGECPCPTSQPLLPSLGNQPLPSDRAKFNTDRLEDLEFSLCIAPTATEVATEAERDRASSTYDDRPGSR